MRRRVAKDGQSGSRANSSTSRRPSSSLSNSAEKKPPRARSVLTDRTIKADSLFPAARRNSNKRKYSEESDTPRPQLPSAMVSQSMLEVEPPMSLGEDDEDDFLPSPFKPTTFADHSDLSPEFTDIVRVALCS